MAEKTVSKHLLNLEKNFATTQPVLQKVAKVFHELDQLEYDLGLIEMEETSARKDSWWPIISLIGGKTGSKNNFINRYLGTGAGVGALQASQHKFTILQYTSQPNTTTLPGIALDADHRLPFYQISNKIEQHIKGAGDKINAYLELKTINSDKLKRKLLIDMPVVSALQDNPVQGVLTQHVIEMSDIVLVFNDVFSVGNEDSIAQLAQLIAKHQDSNKFIYVIDHADMMLDAAKTYEIIHSWQNRLAADLGLNTGQFIVLSNSYNKQGAEGIAAIEQRLANVEYDRSYRILRGLEKSIREIQDIFLPEVRKAVEQWKERCNATTLIVLGFIITLLLFAEITMGGLVINTIFDPILGPIAVAVLIAFLIPLHLLVSKVHAKFIISQLQERQKKLNLEEDLAAVFEKSVTAWRMILPINEPVGSNKKTRTRIKQLIEKTKDLVQVLNDGFSHQDEEKQTD